MNYPTSHGAIRAWARENDTDLRDAEKRFAQYAMLCAVSSEDALRDSLVFKGGNALDFVWQPNRSTSDLDFSIDPFGLEFEPSEATLAARLSQGCEAVFTSIETMLVVNRVRQEPPGPNRTFVTFRASFSYAFPDELDLQARLRDGKNVARGLPMDISINEPICASTTIAIDAERTLRISTIEDIVAEKLRALLQQPIRNRSRSQDLLDIAVLVTSDTPPDPRLVGEFALRKARARDVTVSRAQFRDPAVARRAAERYDEVLAAARRRPIPFEEALAILLAFVDTLPIPEA